jgi:hypothetical protein
LKEISNTIIRVFESLDKGDDLLYENILKARRGTYANLRARLDAQKGGHLEKADLMSIGSHRDEGSSFEDVSDDDGEVGGIEQEDQEQNKSLDIEKEEDTNKKTKKKKNKGFNLKDLESV